MNNKAMLESGNFLTLGLDLGPTSIGWALIDEGGGRMVASGVRIFPEGVDRDPGGGEKSRSQTRREKRLLRRQVSRRAKRLSELRIALAECGLFPEDQDSQAVILCSDPYPLRAKALDHQLEPFEIGRVFYHLAQRRGFLSNRKSDRAKGSDSGVVSPGISELRDAMAEFSSRTAGEYFAALKTSGEKVRKRYTHRNMYEDEFAAVWEAQQLHHPELLTAELRYGATGRQTYPEYSTKRESGDQRTVLQRFGIHGLIFFQRRTYWPVSAVGRCELEPQERRCPRADRLAQRFRILQEVNNLRYRDPLTGLAIVLNDDQRRVLADDLGKFASRNFIQIRKLLVKHGMPADALINIEHSGKKELKGNETDGALQSPVCLGKKRWQQLDETTRDRIVTILVDESDTDQEILTLLADDCGLDPEEAQAAMLANTPDGHGSLSKKAIEKLLPFVEQGLQLMGTDKTNSALFAAGYLPLDVKEGARLAPVPTGITNPIVRQALHETRKVVNAIIREYGLPARIAVELAREARKSFADRQEILNKNRKLEKEREEAVNRLIEDVGIDQPKRNDILKYRLWEQVKGVCVYCGKKIGVTQLRNGEANIDHILPRWRSLDDSYMNKVISHRTCNADKGDRTPREWLEESDPTRYALVLSLGKQLEENKFDRFSQRDIVLDDFVGRHLSDTTYISRQVRDYLTCLGKPVGSSKGTITAELRRSWGLNTILFPEGQGKKTREDHRHHAVDAVVVALATPARLHQLARARGGAARQTMPPPWPDFRAAVEESITAINVSHKPRRKLSGALHEDTFYGPTQKRLEADRVPAEQRPWAKGWQEGEGLFVRRKLVAAITTPKHLAKVRDAALRKVFAEHLHSHGVDPAATSYPKGIFEGENEPLMPSGTPIRKVRWVESKTTLRPAGEDRGYQFVQPGSNHHISYFDCGTPDKPKWAFRVTTMWDATLRARHGKLPPVDQGDCELGDFVMSLSIGECFLIKDDDGNDQLYILRKIDGTGLVHYKLHTDARKAGELIKENIYLFPARMLRSNARKVTLGPLGAIRRSGD